MNCIIEFVYDGTILSLDKIGVNVYLDQILVGFVEIFAALFCSFIIVKMKRKKFMTICWILIGVFTFVIGILTLLFEHKTN
jgi:mannose/fructose/N-acetylgalactosamine-specific phosphotransferase system component IID